MENRLLRMRKETQKIAIKSVLARVRLCSVYYQYQLNQLIFHRKKTRIFY